MAPPTDPRVSPGGTNKSLSPRLACRELLSSDAMKEYNRARVYLDENYKSQEHFTVSPHPASVTVQGAGSIGTWRRPWEGQTGGVKVAMIEFLYCPWAPPAVAEVRLCHTQEGISGYVEPHTAARVALQTEWRQPHCRDQRPCVCWPFCLLLSTRRAVQPWPLDS